MFRMKMIKQGLIIFLSGSLINTGALAANPGQLPGGMIATHVVVEDLSRTQLRQEIRDNIQHSKLSEKLKERGLSEAEVSERLASLSDIELRQLATQTQEARYGGNILITILVVVLIIFLIKRI